MARKDDLQCIEALYGAPGEGYDTPQGRELMIEVLEEMGLEALTDETLRKLAERHVALDNRPRP